MIFISLIILLAILADSIWCFVIPIISLFLRASYKETDINLVKIYPIIFAFIYFIANIFLSEKSINENIISSARLVVFSALFVHIINNLDKRNLEASRGAYFYYYMGTRLFSIVIERLFDTWHILTIRWKQTRFTKRPKLLFSAFSNFFLEIIVVNNQINLVNFEKGGIANKVESKKYNRKQVIVIPIFKSKKILISHSTIGDIAFLLIILIPSTTILNSNKFLPEIIINILQF